MTSILCLLVLTVSSSLTWIKSNVQLDNNIRITAVLDVITTLQNRFDILESVNQKLKSSVGDLIASSSKQTRHAGLTKVLLPPCAWSPSSDWLLSRICLPPWSSSCESSCAAWLHEFRQSLPDAAPHFPDECVRACARVRVCVVMHMIGWIEACLLSVHL